MHGGEQSTRTRSWRKTGFLTGFRPAARIPSDDVHRTLASFVVCRPLDWARARTGSHADSPVRRDVWCHPWLEVGHENLALQGIRDCRSRRPSGSGLDPRVRARVDIDVRPSDRDEPGGGANADGQAGRALLHEGDRPRQGQARRHPEAGGARPSVHVRHLRVRDHRQRRRPGAHVRPARSTGSAGPQAAHRAEPGHQLDDLPRRDDVHLQAAEGRQVPRRDGLRRRGREGELRPGRVPAAEPDQLAAPAHQRDRGARSPHRRDEALRAPGLVHLPGLARRGLERHHQQGGPRPSTRAT